MIGPYGFRFSYLLYKLVFSIILPGVYFTPDVFLILFLRGSKLNRVSSTNPKTASHDKIRQEHIESLFFRISSALLSFLIVFLKVSCIWPSFFVLKYFHAAPYDILCHIFLLHILLHFHPFPDISLYLFPCISIDFWFWTTSKLGNSLLHNLVHPSFTHLLTVSKLQLIISAVSEKPFPSYNTRIGSNLSFIFPSFSWVCHSFNSS